MIKSTNSRVGIIGASDTRYVMMNFETATFKKWWLEKIGLAERKDISNIYMDTGTMLEKPVIDAYCKKKGIKLNYGDEPFISKEYERLVVNLDAYNETKNVEVKCVAYNKAFNWQFKLDRNYYQQVQVQMLASGLRKTIVLAYGLLTDDYDFSNLVNPKIDEDRLFEIEVEYDNEWLEMQYIPKLKYLIYCFENNKIPTEIGFVRRIKCI